MDQKYCVGYSKKRTRYDQPHDRTESRQTRRTVFADHMQPSILWVREYLAALVGRQETFKLLFQESTGHSYARRLRTIFSPFFCRSLAIGSCVSV